MRACALGRGRALAGVWAGRRRAMGLPALLLLALCAASARGLYFHIGETGKRCFIEEIPDETMAIGQAGEVDRALSCPQDAVGLSACSGTLRTPDGDRASSALVWCPGSRGVWELDGLGGCDCSGSFRRELSHPDVDVSRRRSSCPRPPAWACMWR